MSAAVADRIAQAAAALDVPLVDEAVATLTRLVEELARWNRRIRVVGPSDAVALVDDHVADALGTLRLVRRAEADAWYDIGSGAGLPGLVLAVCLPEVRFVLVEPIAKKAAFISHFARLVGLSNVRVEIARVEALPPGGPTAALSRATFAPDEWVARASALVGPGGLVLVCLGSKDAPAQRAQAEVVDTYRLPVSDATRTNLLLRVP